MDVNGGNNVCFMTLENNKARYNKMFLQWLC